uniref:Uncharacterized protein n=1 Tax=Strigamia maritima TaxID=126957 RepID=T1IQX6_STRMM
MYTKVILACLLAIATASPYKPYAKPAAAPEPEPEPINIDYKMSMYVQDDPSYNYQTREESKDGKIIKGQYTVLEPTGELRIVKYYADETGFHADVQNEAGHSKPNQAPEPKYVQAAPAYNQAAPEYHAPKPAYAQESASDNHHKYGASVHASAAPVPHTIFFQSEPKPTGRKQVNVQPTFFLPTVSLPTPEQIASELHGKGY